MNSLLLFTGLLTLVTFVIHTIWGDKEHRAITPEDKEKRIHWIQSRNAFHLVSIDLLFFGCLLTYAALYNFEGEALLLNVAAVFFAGYALVWLMVLLISRAGKKLYLRLGQWILLLLIAALIFIAK